MPAPNDLNSRIALVKGWTWRPASVIELNPPGEINFACTDHWIDAEGNIHSDVPDFVGTLEGVAWMLRKLGQAWGLHFIEDIGKWCCYDHVGSGGLFYSDENNPGDCVGIAYLSPQAEAADVKDV